jgi:hypothetical protein
MTVFFTVALGAVAVADTITPDGDALTTAVQGTVDLGTVPPGAVLTKNVRFILTCDASKHVDLGQKVNLTQGPGTAAPAGGAITVGSGSIGPIPATWPDDTTGSTNCASPAQTLRSDDTDVGLTGSNSAVQITAPTTPGGPYTYTAKFVVALSPSGNQDSSSVTGAVPQVTYTLMVESPATDTDGDGVADDDDNCVSTSNADQTDADNDGTGDACDPTPNGDTDGDGVDNLADNCPAVSNPGQEDVDGDDSGDACDPNSYGPAAGDLDSSGASGNEGDTLTAFGNFTDADETFVGTISIQSGGAGTVTPAADGSWTWSLATTDNGSGSVTIQADDDEHTPIATQTFNWSAANVAPTADLGNGGPVDEGGSVTISFSNQDDPSSADTTAGFHYAFDCDGGSLAAATYAGSTNTTGSTTCTFPDGPATETVTGIIIDKDGGKTQYSTDVTVNNAIPVVIGGSFASGVDCRVSATLSGMDFSDAGVNDANWTVVIAWGDGNSTTISNVTTQAIANQGHTYHTPGTYTPTVTVTDKDGGEGSASALSLVVSQEYTATFLQPFDATTASHFVINQAKAGRTVPVKVQVYDVCAQRYLTGSDPLPFIGVSTATNINGSDSDAIEVYADAGAANDNGRYFRWSTDGFWIYNLDTRTGLNGGSLVTGSTYRINVFDSAGVRVTDDEWALLKQVR